jgi:hypothetical protein
MTVLLEIKKKENLDALQGLFLGLLEELEVYEDNDKLRNLTGQLRETTESWIASQEPKIPIDQKEFKWLKKVINIYSDLVDEKDFDKNIINTYLLDKPGSMIEIFNKDPVKINEFIDELNTFFFVDFIITNSGNEYTWTIYISRLKDRNETAVAHHHKYNGIHNYYANSIGSYSGYTSKQTWHYCKVNKFHDLIK